MVPERFRSIVTFLIVVIVILLAQLWWQQRRIDALKFDIAFQQRHFDERVGTLAAERLRSHRDEIVRTEQWLHQYYASDEGLRRKDGLWLADRHQPDFEALGAWVFDVYLSARVNGASDEQARQAIVDAIRGSDEWRRVHATP